jgi:hypothetical protein
MVSVVKHDSSPYADLTASEKTSAPVDFVATGLIGNIKIDEVKICGRLDAHRAVRRADDRLAEKLHSALDLELSPILGHGPEGSGGGGLALKVAGLGDDLAPVGKPHLECFSATGLAVKGDARSPASSAKTAA